MEQQRLKDAAKQRANQLCHASYTKSFQRRQVLRRSARRNAVTQEAIRFTTLYALVQASIEGRLSFDPPQRANSVSLGQARAKNSCDFSGFSKTNTSCLTSFDTEKIRRPSLWALFWLPAGGALHPGGTFSGAPSEAPPLCVRGQRLTPRFQEACGAAPGWCCESAFAIRVRNRCLGASRALRYGRKRVKKGEKKLRLTR